MRRSLLVAPGLALVAAVVAVFVPMQHSVVWQSATGPQQTTGVVVSSRSLLQTEGASVLFAAGLPVVVALLPLAFARSRPARRVEVMTAALLGVFVVLAGFSIGFLYLPAAAAAVVVARRPQGTSMPMRRRGLPRT